MLNGTLTKRYAVALFMVSAKQNHVVQIDEVFLDVVKVLTDVSTQSFFAHPLIQPKSKLEILNNAFDGKLDPTLLGLLMILFTRKRTNYVPMIQEAYHLLANESVGRTEVKLETAQELTAEQLSSTLSELEMVLKHKVVADVQVDPQLIAGYRLRIGNRMIDASTKGALTQFGHGLSNVRIGREGKL